MEFEGCSNEIKKISRPMRQTKQLRQYSTRGYDIFQSQNSCPRRLIMNKSRYSEHRGRQTTLDKYNCLLEEKTDDAKIS